MRKLFAILILAAALPLAASAHGGGLNAEGCHTNRKTGDYHCHRASAPARPTERAATPPASNALLRPRPSTDAYRNCNEARAAGAAPVRRGEPGYGAHLDRDNDGIGCE
tara:strand:+ start:93946 stop:94272 length:327 start_codon:yes stop_codon:yes gene_type:complete